MSKSVIGPMNSNKNKLNSEIVFIFHPNPNAHIFWLQIKKSAYFTIQFIFAVIHGSYDTF